MSSKTSHDQLVAILEAARCEPIGIVLVVNDPVRARAALYRARTVENNPAYSDLQFRVWPHEDGDLVICHDARLPRQTPNNLGRIDLTGVLELDLDNIS